MDSYLWITISCYTSLVKKLILPIILVLLMFFGISYLKRNEVPKEKNPTISTFKSSSLGITFTYPKVLTASSTSGVITLHHEVPFVHHDYCDFRGEGNTTLNNLTDFNVKIHVVNKGLVETMKTESPYIPQENYVNGKVVPSPGFIDSYKVGELEGFRIFEGAEGCGHTIYYLKVTESKTLVVVNDLITVFTGAIDQESESAAEAVPGVINKEKAEAYFESILSSLKI